MRYDFDQVIERRKTNSVKWETSFGEGDILPMWVADMDFRVPQPVIDALHKTAEHGIFGYSHGQASFDESIMDWMQKRHNWQVEREWLSFSPGVVPALNWLVRCLTKPGDKVALQSPVYPPFYRAITSNGCEVVNSSLKLEAGRYVMDFADLAEKFARGVKVFLLCSPHNPVGRVWTVQELQELGKLCKRYDVTVIEDEIHNDLIYKAYEHTVFPVAVPELLSKTVVCTAPSKTFNLAGLQSSTIIIPDKGLRKAFRRVQMENAGFHPNTFAIAALEAAYRYGEEWLDQLLDYLQGNLDFLCKFIEEKIPRAKVVKPEGTYLVWLDFRELGLEPQALQDFMRQKAKVACNEGYTFGFGGEGFERMNIACPRSTLAEGLRRIAEAVAAL